jgi:hypothetical protein
MKRRIRPMSREMMPFDGHFRRQILLHSHEHRRQNRRERARQTPPHDQALRGSGIAQDWMRVLRFG